MLRLNPLVKENKILSEKNYELEYKLFNPLIAEYENLKKKFSLHEIKSQGYADTVLKQASDIGKFNTS